MEASLSLAYVLIVLGLLLLVAELFIPSGGMLFVLSMAGIVIGITMTFLYSEDPSRGILSLIFVCIAIPALLLFMAHWWPKTSMGKRFFLQNPDEDATVARMPVNMELEQLRGRYGRTLSALRPAGVTEFDGRKIDTLSEGMMIEAGQWVRCIDVKAGKVIVRQVEGPNLGTLESADFT